MPLLHRVHASRPSHTGCEACATLAYRGVLAHPRSDTPLYSHSFFYSTLFSFLPVSRPYFPFLLSFFSHFLSFSIFLASFRFYLFSLLLAFFFVSPTFYYRPLRPFLFFNFLALFLRLKRHAVFNFIHLSCHLSRSFHVATIITSINITITIIVSTVIIILIIPRHHHFHHHCHQHHCRSVSLPASCLSSEWPRLPRPPPFSSPSSFSPHHHCHRCHHPMVIPSPRHLLTGSYSPATQAICNLSRIYSVPCSERAVTSSVLHRPHSVPLVIFFLLLFLFLILVFS